jgi:hypothetical protein
VAAKKRKPICSEVSSNACINASQLISFYKPETLEVLAAEAAYVPPPT